MSSTVHSTPAELAGLLSGALTGSAWRRVERHVRVCGSCGTRYAAVLDGPVALWEERETAASRARDAELYADMREAGFTGSVYEAFVEEMWRYGTACLQAWMYNGSIGAKCHKYRLQIHVAWYHRNVWAHAPEVREELATDAVADAVKRFRNVLREGRWDAKRSSLRTYFIGACLLAFADVFRAWSSRLAREHAWLRSGLAPLMSRGHHGDDGPDVAADRDTLARILEKANDKQVLMICLLIYAEDATHQEIGERMGGLPPRAVEARLRRLRTKARRMAAAGEITVSPHRLVPRTRRTVASMPTRPPGTPADLSAPPMPEGWMQEDWVTWGEGTVGQTSYDKIIGTADLDVDDYAW